MNEAIETCRDYKGGPHEFRFITRSIDFYASLECWDIVERLHDRLNVLHNLYTWKDFSSSRDELALTDTDLILSQLLMARGNVVEAEQVLERIRDRVKAFPYRTKFADLLLHWSIGLLNNGKYESALDKIREGLQYTEGKFLPFHAAKFSILLAKTELELGNHKNVEQALQYFDHHASICTEDLQREWIEYHATRGRLMLLTGKREPAFEALGEGFILLKESLTGMDGSVHAYLWLGKCEPLRMLMHDLASDDPELGYGAELYWRDLYRAIGNGLPGDGQSAGSIPERASQPPHASSKLLPVKELFREKARWAKRCIGEHGAVHCLYLARDDEMWRWTVSNGSIRSEVLDYPANEMRALVAETRKMLAGDDCQGAAMQPALAANLRLLAKNLLPPELAYSEAAKRPSLFIVSAEGFLGCIPFEAFDIGVEGEYTPLLAWKDVVYARFIRCHRQYETAAPGIILVNTHASQEVQKRYPFQPRLSEVHIEADTMAALDPDACILRGESATKANLLQRWEDASYLYFATHTLSDPEVPYLVHIPLAPSETQIGIEATYLDVTDIRTADLGRCNLVVISGCSSGVPYVEIHTNGPSLGDAFLDSGAGAVIQTFWDVRDDAARVLMTRFVKLSDGMRSPIQAICEARREAMRGLEGMCHPSNWASYSIELGRVPVR